MKSYINTAYRKADACTYAQIQGHCISPCSVCDIHTHARMCMYATDRQASNGHIVNLPKNIAHEDPTAYMYVCMCACGHVCSFSKSVSDMRGSLCGNMAPPHQCTVCMHVGNMKAAYVSHRISCQVFRSERKHHSSFTVESTHDDALVYAC